MPRSTKPAKDPHAGMVNVRGVWVPKGSKEGCPSALIRGSKRYHRDPQEIAALAAYRQMMEDAGRNTLVLGD